MDKNETIKYL
jgi:hypothetical protein